MHYVPGKTDVQCRERWMNVLHPNINLQPWTRSEDMQLVEMVNRFGLSRWAQLATHLSNRTDNQAWRRWKKFVAEKLVESVSVEGAKDMYFISVFLGGG